MTLAAIEGLLHSGQSWRGPRVILLSATLALACGLADPTDIGQGLADFSAGRFAEALTAWQAAAQTGDPAGDLYIGVLYDSGQGVAQDYAQALTWYKRAAAAGSAAGAFNVGVFYDNGLGVEQDQREAAEWYGRAAARGFPRAEYNLALLEEQGDGVPRDRAKAIRLFRQAAAQGLTAARAHLAALGQRYAGSTTKPPHDDAMADFQHAQDTLLSRGAVESASMAALFRNAADRHNAVAEYDLGYCYEHGVGVAADPSQAYSWYQRAVADSHDSPLRNIARESAAKLERQLAATNRSG